MRLLRRLVKKPSYNVWSDVSGNQITTEEMAEFYFEGSDYAVSKAEPDWTEEQEIERQTANYLLGLASGGYNITTLDTSVWPDMEGKARFIFDGYEDGMLERGDGSIHMSFVDLSGPFSTVDFPDEMEDHVYDEGGKWVCVQTYTMSSEQECEWCGTGTGNEEHRDECALCDGDGYLGLDEGNRVAIYKYVRPEETE